MTTARIPRPDVQLLLAGAALTFATGIVAAGPRGPLVLTALAGLAFFVGTAACFVVAPHLAVAATIPLFALLPTIRALAIPSIGPLKDAVTAAAALALLVVAVRAREQGKAWLDRRLGLAIAFLLALYVVNIGGLVNGTAFTSGWMHGVRLVDGAPDPAPRRSGHRRSANVALGLGVARRDGGHRARCTGSISSS